MTSYSLPSFVRPHAFINGEWVESAQSFPVFNPATTTKICDVSDVTNDDIENAILCAKNAQKI